MERWKKPPFGDDSLTRVERASQEADVSLIREEGPRDGATGSESISIFNNVMMTYSDFGVPTGSGNSAAGTPAQTRAPAPSSVPGQPPASSEHKVENTTPDSVVHSSTGLRTPTGSNESHGL
ncbi:hypothetical protein AAG570_007402 [Ranatra chinensis]|uniref:Uncharacterized protein n=1 Tax=Ranatra chinensis TaxID=642074 RepID=A0ABD0XVR8_9HEMI